MLSWLRMDLSLRKYRKRSLDLCGKPKMENSPAETTPSQESLEPLPCASPAPFMQTTSPKALNEVSQKLDEFMESVNKRLDSIESVLCGVREELQAARENEQALKRQKLKKSVSLKFHF